MSALRGVVLGSLGLTFLEAVVSNQQAANNVGGLFGTAANVLKRLTDVSVPLIPDRRTPAAPTQRIIADAYTVQTPGGATAGTVPTGTVSV